ncbi:hypothetical protein GCM10027425_03340 [Alteromonas gracilis]
MARTGHFGAFPERARALWSVLGGMSSHTPLVVSRRPRITPPAGAPVWDHRPTVQRPHRALVLLHRLADVVAGPGLRPA